MLKVVLVAVGVLVGIIVLLGIVGALLPQAHVARSTVTLRQPADTVWTVIRDFESYPSWWSNVKAVERLPEGEDREVWNQLDRRNQAMPIEVVESDPPSRMVTRIADENLPFGGSWTYEIEQTPDGTMLTITEAGEIYNPFFLVISRFIMGYHGTMDSYLEAVGKKLGEDVTPTHRN